MSQSTRGSEESLRRQLVTWLAMSGAHGLREEGLEEAFIEGDVNPSFDQTGLDSLSRMELCIAIENELGVSIAPVELEKMKSLGALLRRIDRG